MVTGVSNSMLKFDEINHSNLSTELIPLHSASYPLPNESITDTFHTEATLYIHAIIYFPAKVVLFELVIYSWDDLHCRHCRPSQE